MTEMKNDKGEVFWNVHCENPVAAINFALDAIDDHWERLEFLKSWREGDIAPWPEFLDFVSPY